MIKKNLFLVLGFLLFPCLSFAEIDWNEREIKWYGYLDGKLEAKKQKKTLF